MKTDPLYQQFVEMLDEDQGIDWFPRFMIVIGQGLNYTERLLDAFFTDHKLPHSQAGHKVDNVRETIAHAVSNTAEHTYIFTNGDAMSVESKNALLKVTEEAPQRTHFILVTENINNILPTLISRAQVFQMQEPSAEQVRTEAIKMGVDDARLADMVSMASNIDDIADLMDIDLQSSMVMIDNMINTLVDASLPNAMKIGTTLGTKETDTALKATVFMKAYMRRCNEYLKGLVENTTLTRFSVAMLSNNIVVTSKYLGEMRLNGVPKSRTLDMWIMELWETGREIANVNG